MCHVIIAKKMLEEESVMTSKENCNDNTPGLVSNHHISRNEVINYDRLNYEEERLKTFTSWPVRFPVDPSRLAKAGFYYSGSGDEVICFSCKGHVKNWNYGDIVLKKHAALYPNCDFINNQSKNVPLLKNSLRPVKSHSVDKKNTCASTNSLQSVSIDFNKMKSEYERLKTFSRNWPLSFINTSDLARAGFFYTGADCRVQCPYCQGVISNWNVNSIPIQEHLKQFPWCKFLSENTAQAKKAINWFQSSSQDICNNVTKQTTSSHNNPSPSSTLISDNLQNTNLEDLGVLLYKGPAHPQQASLSARLRTFETWPYNVSISKECLAAAGFFYIGIGDRTICFYCNGGLCTWEKSDDPWEEHARWFPTCAFLHLNKGSEFIKSCTAKNLPKLKDYSQESSVPSTEEPILKKVDAAMKSNLAKQVLETGLFPPYIVRAAFILQIKQTGDAFKSIEDLHVAASYLKEEMENQSSDIKPVEIENLNINNSERCSQLDVSVANDRICTTSPGSKDSDSAKEAFLSGKSEKQNSVGEEELSDQCICKICMDRKVGVVFLPCGHLHACTVCAPALKHCPMCRKPIQATVRVYLD